MRGQILFQSWHRELTTFFQSQLNFHTCFRGISRTFIPRTWSKRHQVPVVPSSTLVPLSAWELPKHWSHLRNLCLQTSLQARMCYGWSMHFYSKLLLSKVGLCLYFYFWYWGGLKPINYKSLREWRGLPLHYSSRDTQENWEHHPYRTQNYRFHVHALLT